MHHRVAFTSDHCMLLLRDLPSRCKPTARSKLFRFEAMWLQDNSCAEVVDRAWEKGINSRSEKIFLKCLEECRSSLTIWNKTNLGHIGRKVAYLQKQLQRLGCQNDALVNMEEVQNTKMESNKMLDIERYYGSNVPGILGLRKGTGHLLFPHKIFK